MKFYTYVWKVTRMFEICVPNAFIHRLLSPFLLPMSAALGSSSSPLQCS